MSSSSTTLPSSRHGQSSGQERGCSTPVMQKRPLSDDTHLHIQSQAAPQPSNNYASEDNSQLHSSSSLPAPTDRQGHHASTTLQLGRIAVKRLKSLNMHLTYFMNDKTDIKFCSIYIVRAMYDFGSNPDFNLSWTKLWNTKLKLQANSMRHVYRLAYLLCVPYAFFHVSAWHAHFPTTIERWLWHGAGLLTVGSPVPMLLSFELLKSTPWMKKL